MATSKLNSWRYIGDYEGQHPGYCELDDPPHPVKVKVYGRGNNRKALNGLGQVEFTYIIYQEALKGVRWQATTCPHVALVMLESKPSQRIWRE